ncbi:STAS/SEC14 domain-containing protein [Saprospira sp. CCB-QB6]|uniref:DUF7793 family protein n=1 Tax=Saprospira sp. CCB-QB6 TaxID=3023936 RepID=UPI00234A9961|nr:STAS/SEC14 domain-containing protein [Saprospira sp. CCB-QB6]WCL81944.1 STAS/SEC14 domain-containing protein [Saprospira sp. CCB-QB6]
MNLEKIGVAGPTHYFLRPDGIIYTQSFEPTPITLAVFQANFEFIKQLSEERNEQLRMIINIANASSLDKDARNLIRSAHIQTHYGGYIAGVAILAANQLSRMIGNFMLGLRGKTLSPYPLKVFVQQEKAANWLDAI